MLYKVLNLNALEGTKHYPAQPTNVPGISPIFTLCLAPEDIGICKLWCVHQVQVQIFRVRSWVGQLSLQDLLAKLLDFVGHTVSVATVGPCCRSKKAAIDNNTQTDERGCGPVNFVYGHGNLRFIKLSPIPEYYYSFDCFLPSDLVKTKVRMVFIPFLAILQK